MIPMPLSPVASAPLSRSPSRRGRSRTRSPINSESVVVLRSRSARRSSSPSWRLPSGSPRAPPTCVLTPPPVRCPSPPPSVCPTPMPRPIIINPPSRSSISTRSRSVSRSPRSFYVNNSSSRSRSRSHSPPRYPMPPPIPCYRQPPHTIPFLGPPICGWVPIPVVHHPRFYFQDGNVTLEVGFLQVAVFRIMH
ncbi:hypothetical protein EDD85DRAFT_390213 [Armillaria nabsnona]|nr:hypothetical protein EDD85DRAFT_390213 [Armillaria nabsnona]